MAKQSKYFVRYDRLLVTATDKMQEYLDKMTLYPDNTVYLMEASAIACGTLGRLQDNPRFREDVEKVHSFSSQLADVEEFSDSFEEFMQVEREILTKGGLSATSVSLLTAQCRTCIRNFHDRRGSTPEDVIGSVYTLRTAACEIADQLSSKYRDNERLMRWRKRARIVGLGLGGATVIGLNFSPITTTVGLSTVGSQLSGEIGVGMIYTAAAMLT
ncbi:hypothetical protein KDW_38250 [Dictyobacter vulcani]|uniref:Uncharacterized protein n=1 Tax=Dictyobacter vulcani TaxID=2607529 RepID=A0A5J4KPZ1_9CHLR|nr:hypothetical protein [Dictyobacter vulcani]GER89663.1 hypothetical protein KDW_38250 [Dictyobacter vulcani]